MVLFVRSAVDIFGIDPEVMFHHLKVDLTYQSVKQKKQSFIPEHQKAISEEVDKLLKADFI